MAVCDIDPAKLAMAAERYPELRATDERGRAPRAIPTIDVVSVASYDDAHFEQIRTALEHGKHVFAEKPLVLDARGGARARARCSTREPRLRLSTNVPLRLQPALRSACAS